MKYTKSILKTMARQRTEGFDAYLGVWDKPIWLVVQVNETFGTVLGHAFTKGDVTLARYGKDIPGTPPGIANQLFAYSFLSGGEVSINDFRILEKAS